MQKTIDKKDSELDQYKLVSDALQAKQKPEQIEAVKEFQRLFKEEFLKFADEESSLADEASVVLHLQEVQHKMERIAAFPELEVKTMGAIGGGFSSGKSSFINSFITVPNIRLAEGIKPVTVIPSYVTYSEKVEIRGSTQNGASFLIDKDTYKSISHELLQDLSFDLKQVIPYMTVSCPMDKNLFGNICLIDTPGYNAPVVGFAGSDEETAFNYIKDAGFLIWLVGVDASGVISKSDFEFLKKLDFGKDREKELYVVINKAELRKESDRESLLDTAADFLADNDVTYTGICAYSSRKKQMFSHRKMKLEDFLQKKNKPGRAINQLDNAIDEVFNRYKSALTDDRDNTSSRRKQFMSLQNYISIISLDVEDTDKIDKIDEYLSSIIRELTTDEFDKHLETCEKLRKKFKLCVVDFCDKLGIKQDATHGTGRYKETLQQMAVILSGAIKNSGGDPENMMSSQTKP
jgi:hypothetical protein